MIGNPVARVAVTLLTLFAYAAAVSLPAVLLWLAYSGLGDVLETVQP